MLEGVVTDEKSLRLCLCKKKKRIQKAPSQFSAVSIFMFDSFLASSSAISWQKRLLFLLSVWNNRSLYPIKNSFSFFCCRALPLLN